ncbi:hypothetical protein BABINDRAFT_159279 [Babjeviella inositovora NRRL Y-12698]|uniref:DUF1892 domain-containing protein n=1 Tax=Babjeviella inositovora NRRL Y-12698 TaxID=984486 RepID=A0A1E3QYQ6_9ASCO|nr:uncharacterized protein BABINDRAFT_159279 [Babjeviella inositovora NRRL Y-12698]ODQ82766.1 hypothetical protein BABINDRAFT_159279 [Babjeviella inositovora NRRL Y-12698]
MVGEKHSPSEEESDFPSHLENDIDPNEKLDNPISIMLVWENPDKEEGNEMTDIALPGVQTFQEMNDFFDQFDEVVAIPNEGNIKYDVGSDGLVVIVVQTPEIRLQVTEFIDKFKSEHKESE